MPELDINIRKIHFEKASTKHQDTLFQWLNEPHMKEFWDNSQEHREDILNFILVESNTTSTAQLNTGLAIPVTNHF
jgi:hypothetical protein